MYVTETGRVSYHFAALFTNSNVHPMHWQTAFHIAKFSEGSSFEIQTSESTSHELGQYTKS
jgi:hypothetical protein